MLNAADQLYVSRSPGFSGVGRSAPIASTEVFGISGAGPWVGMYVQRGINQNPYYGRRIRRVRAVP